ncbi:MAG: non-homologous end-joining DNA ligase [Limnochordia bacterium]|jgi:bifunctional non-homologous end joining protein LigD
MTTLTTSIVEIDGRRISLSNLDKPLWPQAKITKGDLIHYFYQMAQHLLPHLRDRPLTVTRYPNGIEGDFFYQKQCPAYAPQWIATYTVSSPERNIDYIVANDRATLVWLANQACIELHPWLSRKDNLTFPDRIIIDLDPDPPAGFAHAVQVAKILQGLLETMGLRSFPKTSGATGIHIYIPIEAKYSYRVTSQFVGFLGELLARHQPQLVTNARLIKNRRGRVYVDHLQNLAGKTIVAPYSPRPTPQGTVSAPFPWSELEHIHPEDFTIGTMGPHQPPWFQNLDGIQQNLDHLLPLFEDRLS